MNRTYSLVACAIFSVVVTGCLEPVRHTSGSNAQSAQVLGDIQLTADLPGNPITLSQSQIQVTFSATVRDTTGHVMSGPAVQWWGRVTIGGNVSDVLICSS